MKVKRLHFICRDDLNVTVLENGDFVSGYWRVGADVALNAEFLALHATKDHSSYRQGAIVGRKLHEDGQRYIFRVSPSDDSIDWEGEGAGEKGYGY